jgi:hypothetical protein
MATDKSYAELKDDTKRILEKWQPILERCGHLEELEEKLFLANTLEKLTSKAQDVQGIDYVLPDGGTLNVIDQTGTHRLVIEYDDNLVLCANRQHKDWVNG